MYCDTIYMGMLPGWTVQVNISLPSFRSPCHNLLMKSFTSVLSYPWDGLTWACLAMLVGWLSALQVGCGYFCELACFILVACFLYWRKPMICYLICNLSWRKPWNSDLFTWPPWGTYLLMDIISDCGHLWEHLHNS